MVWGERNFFLAEQAYLQPEEQCLAACGEERALRLADLLLAAMLEERDGKGAKAGA